MKMVPNAKVSPRPSQCQSQSKDFDGQEISVERHSQPPKIKERRKGKNPWSPLSEGSKHCSLGKLAQISLEERPLGLKLDH